MALLPTLENNRNSSLPSPPPPAKLFGSFPLYLPNLPTMSTELMTELLEAGVHFGHQTKRWNPKMKPFIFEKRNAIYIIDLGKTVAPASRPPPSSSAKIAGRNGKVLFVGCKKQAQEAIKEAAEACGQFYVNQRWLGGTLTNLQTIRKSVGRLKYIEELEKQPEFSKMGKQEISAVKREGEKLHRNLDGIRDMEKQPDAIVIIDTMREGIAVAEARRLEHPDRRHRRYECRPRSDRLPHRRQRRRHPRHPHRSCRSSWTPSSPHKAPRRGRSRRPWPASAISPRAALAGGIIQHPSGIRTSERRSPVSRLSTLQLSNPLSS